MTNLYKGIEDLIGEVLQGRVGAGGISDLDNGLLGRLLDTRMFPLCLQTDVLQI